VRRSVMVAMADAATTSSSEHCVMSELRSQSG
jgi:hypothetical protein